MGIRKSDKRLMLESMDLVGESNKFKSSYLIEKYQVTQSMFNEVLSIQLKRGVSAKDDANWEEKMLRKPSDGTWMRSTERQYLINNRAFINK